ncbi:MAG: hypothetical protein EOP10_11450 [Proteobacteria bacterium]|nr:MAG: hypothetical protein EOP10_11450 [Pseudomonadota bacterium]
MSTQSMFQNISLTLLAVALSSTAHARWDHRQADRLDRFDKIGHEYYNDVLSYRAPWGWDEQAKNSKVQLRTHAGSLNQKEFAFGHSLSIHTDNDDPWGLAYEAIQYDDRRIAIEQDNLALSYRPEESKFKYTLLADGFGDKAYSDIGLGLEWRGSDKTRLYSSIWAVDPFYDLKKIDATESRSADNWSMTYGFEQKVSNLTVNGQYLQDTPVEWKRLTRDQKYSYEQQLSQLDLVWDEPTADYYTSVNHHWLKESLGALSNIVRPGFSHTEDTLEIGAKQEHGKAKSQIALWGLSSDTDYRGKDASLALIAPAEDPLLKRIKRKEIAAFATWHEPWSEGSVHAHQWGLFANRIMKEEDLYRIYTEVKVQWAMDWAIGKQGRFLLGTTWDADEIVARLVREGKTLRPWGGGFTQIMIDF